MMVQCPSNGEIEKSAIRKSALCTWSFIFLPACSIISLRRGSSAYTVCPASHLKCDKKEVNTGTSYILEAIRAVLNGGVVDGKDGDGDQSEAQIVDH
jgi:hypothetical protein